MDAASRTEPAAAAAAAFVESFNPASGELLGAVPATDPADVQRVVDAVAHVQPLWAALRPEDRARYMRRAAQAIVDELDELRDLIAREQGKPLAEAYLMELLPTIDTLHWLADAAPRLLADERVGLSRAYFPFKRARLAFEPLGVVGVIAPWNYPWTIPLGEVAFALMAGNGVVLKPAPLTCLTGERIGHAFARAGIPEGLVRVVHGGPEVGRALVASSVAKVFFTGSVGAGRDVAESCARALKGAVLELGGKDPMLVLADANVPRAIRGALWGGAANAGQTCAGIERVYVAREVSERFVAGLIEGARRLRVGDPLDWATQVGPMASREQHEKVRALVDDAVAAGATLHCGGPAEVPGLPGPFYAPAVLTGVTHAMRIMREEVFGPVIPVMTVDGEDEAIALANDCELALGASVWTADRPKGERIARELDAGMVWINDHMVTHAAAQVPWGGVKASGLGRAHGEQGLRECVSVKLLTWDPPRGRAPWWYPYDATLGRAARAAAKLRSHRDIDRERALREGAWPLLRIAVRTLRSVRRR